jgi:RNA polymerase sigma factor (TIGR02999 family)
MSASVSLTEQIRLYMQGDPTATDALLREVLPKLHEIAVRELKRERYMAPLSKTELIHEIWLSSLSRGGWQIRDRGHFFALACLAMRRVLVSLARKRLAERRGGGESVLPLDAAGPRGSAAADAQQIVEIGIAMERLEADDPEAARVVDMHYFTGATLDEIAKETGLTFRQVRSRWERGRRALKNLLRGDRIGVNGRGPGRVTPDR